MTPLADFALDVAQPPISFAKEPIGEINDSLPIRPDLGRPTAQDLWEDMIKKRPPRKPPKSKSDIKRPGTDGQIDEYA